MSKNATPTAPPTSAPPLSVCGEGPGERPSHGRTGFAKLALRTGATIVPIASAGTHEQLVVLTRGDRIARALSTKRWIRIETFPLVFALAWGITLGYLPYLPLPAQTTLSFGAPLRWPDVEAGIQRELDRVAQGRVPFIGA